ncbi:hypothetical protein J6590_032485 [Homalodisca vitripennis]|nr:hypothetical protein J6590_032485 [Homalodisca vitripennis]
MANITSCSLSTSKPQLLQRFVPQGFMSTGPHAVGLLHNFLMTSDLSLVRRPRPERRRYVVGDVTYSTIMLSQIIHNVFGTVLIYTSVPSRSLNIYRTL